MKNKIFFLLKYVLLIHGIVFSILILLSLTDIPYYAYHYLGTTDAELNQKPDVIILLGGSGMPSPDGLIRTYYTAEAANKFPNSKIIIALPSNVNDSLHQLKLMAKELMIKGVDSLRIVFEPNGYNTHSQAMNIASMYDHYKLKPSILVVSSPEHIYRSVKTFRKVGFHNVGGMPCFERPPDEEKIKDKEKSRDVRVKNISLRYNIWSYLQYEILVLREYCAILYYKSKNWM